MNIINIRILKFTGVEQSGDEGSVTFVPDPTFPSKPDLRFFTAGAGLRSHPFLAGKSKLNLLPPSTSSRTFTFDNESLLQSLFVFFFPNSTLPVPLITRTSLEIKSSGSPTHALRLGTGLIPRTIGTGEPESKRVTCTN
ncbi:hypothetical protein HanIR_Chr01g0029671 [Helianthus annuus]|nr:hypothetical protein HanIR_Chr01g0029671 [Helianthus annuus]